LSSSQLPSTALAAETSLQASRRRNRLRRERALRGLVPYSLVAPAIVVVVAVLAYPLYELVRLSFQHYGLFELIRRQGQWIGLDNYRSILQDPVFWRTLERTVVFTIANVALTMGLGTLIALLMTRLGAFVRVLLGIGLMLAWAMPPVVGVQVWYWMTNYQNGVVNYVLGMGQHDWYTTSFSQLALVTTLVVWAALPFVVVTIYAGLAQVPGELVEAAAVDGAAPWRVLRDVTFPILKPIFLILASLSIIWDFGVFTQPFLLIDQTRINASNELMGIYLYEEGYVKTDFGRGAAISILMLLIVSVLSIVYVRKMVRTGDEAA
jgi:N,N'-diacetylchitobiose transport system permease protein